MGGRVDDVGKRVIRGGKKQVRKPVAIGRRSFRCITFSHITVLIGPNGGGKSALFDAILNFSMLSRGSIKQAFGHYPYSYSATKCRGAAGYERIGFDVEMSKAQGQNERLRYTINYSQLGIAEPGNPSFEIKTESLALSTGAQLFDRDHA